MRTIASTALLASVILFTSGWTGAGDKKVGKDGFDAAKLVGTWKYVSGEKAGEKVDSDTLKKGSVVIDKENFTLMGGDLFIMKYKVDGAKKPAGIAFEITKSPFGPGAKAAGVIEIKGDELHLCYNPEGGDAPTKFETKGSKAHYFVLRREKK